MDNTFPELENYYKKLDIEKSPDSVRGYHDSIGRFVKYFKINSISDIESITFGSLIEFQSSLKDGGLKFTSVNSHILRIKAFWNNLLYREIIKNDCINKIKQLERTREDGPKERGISLTEEEEKAMIDACKDVQSRLMLTMMFNMGLRRSEVTNIKIEDIKDCQLLIKGKGMKNVKFSLRPEVCEMINKFMNERKSTSDYLFYSNKGKTAKNKISGQAVRDRVVLAAQNAGISEERIKKIGSHTLRRTCGSRIAKKYGILVAREVLRHSSVVTTELYVEPDDSQVQNALLGLEL